MAFFRNGVFVTDPWAPETEQARGLFSLADWLDIRDAGRPLPSPLGLKLEPGIAVESLAADIGRFALITVAFPKFTDGRGYSMGWLLRSRFGYRGELRAVGDVLFDEMQFMLRCGFDSFEVTDINTMQLLKEGRQVAFDRYYQPGLEPEIPEGTRPWARRAATTRRGPVS